MRTRGIVRPERRSRSRSCPLADLTCVPPPKRSWGSRNSLVQEDRFRLPFAAMRDIAASSEDDAFSRNRKYSAYLLKISWLSDGVGAGDVFLFWGLYRTCERSAAGWRYTGPRVHLILVGCRWMWSSSLATTAPMSSLN